MGSFLVILGITTAGFAGEITPTNFKADYQKIDALKQKLADNGLQVLGTHSVAGSNDYTVVLYTAPALQAAAQAPGRGFAGVLRILVDKQAQQLVASNPEYYLRAFLQKEYKDGMEAPVLAALKKSLGTLTPSEDAMKTQKLSNYNFMIGMPHYDDFQCVGMDGTTTELCKKLETSAKDKIVFKLNLKADGSSVLYGVALSPEVEGFNLKLDTMGKSHLLPYTVLIENDTACILPARYYLALSFPQLSMTEFGRIMSTPGKIQSAFEAFFE